MTTTNNEPSSCDLAQNAKAALERVCSGAGLDSADRYYSPAFVESCQRHQVPRTQWVERSVGLYRKIFAELAISVEEQLVDRDR